MSCGLARISNTYIILMIKSISRETNFIFTIFPNDDFKYKSKIYIKVDELYVIKRIFIIC